MEFSWKANLRFQIIQIHLKVLKNVENPEVLQVINFPILHLKDQFRNLLRKFNHFFLRSEHKRPAENDEDQFNYQF